MRAHVYMNVGLRRTIQARSKVVIFRRTVSQTASTSHVNAQPGLILDSDEELALKLRQLTTNARTLVRARRPEDAERVIDEGLEMFPWQSSLWFWKLATKVGDSKGAIEAWDTMTRMGVQKLPEHFDIMATAISHVEARHVVIELFYELLEQNYIGNPKFYTQFFIACTDAHGLLHAKGMAAYQEMLKDSKFEAILTDEGVKSALMRFQTGKTTLARSQVAESSLPLAESSSRKMLSSNNRFSLQDPASEPLTAKFGEESMAPVSLQRQDLMARSLPMSESSSDERPLSTTNMHIPAQMTPLEHATGEAGSCPAALPENKSALASREDPVSLIRSQLEPFFRSQRHDVRAHTAALEEARELLKSSHVSLETYNYVLRNAALLEGPENLERILEDAIGKGHKPDATTYNPILRSYFQSGQPDQALDLIERMELSNVKFTYQSILEILRGLMHTDRTDDALEFFVDVFKDGSDLTIIPGKDGEIKCFATVIAGLCRDDRAEDAIKLVAVMIQRGLTPNIPIYKDLVKTCFARDLVLEAMRYFEMAIEIPKQARLSLHWKQDLDDLVATVVGGFLDADRYEEAEKFMNKASSEGHWHSTIVKPWTHFIDWLARKDRIDDAYSLFSFHNIKSLPAAQRYQLFSTMLQAVYLDKGDVHGGLKWFTKMQQECQYFEQHPYQVLISAAMIEGEREVAERVWALAKDYLRLSGERMTRSLENTAKRWDLPL